MLIGMLRVCVKTQGCWVEFSIDIEAFSTRSLVSPAHLVQCVERTLLALDTITTTCTREDYN